VPRSARPRATERSAADGVMASVVSGLVPVGIPRATTKPAASNAARTDVDAEYVKSSVSCSPQAANTRSKHPSVHYMNDQFELWTRPFPKTDIWGYSPGAASAAARVALSAADADSPLATRRFREVLSNVRPEKPVLVEKVAINNFRIGGTALRSGKTSTVPKAQAGPVSKSSVGGRKTANAAGATTGSNKK